MCPHTVYTQVSLGENLYTCITKQIACLSYMCLCYESYLILSVKVVICAGARADTQDEDGKTPLELAEEELVEQSDAKTRQQYDKVQKANTNHTLIISINANGEQIEFSSF